MGIGNVGVRGCSRGSGKLINASRCGDIMHVHLPQSCELIGVLRFEWKSEKPSPLHLQLLYISFPSQKWLKTQDSELTCITSAEVIFNFSYDASRDNGAGQTEHSFSLAAAAVCDVLLVAGGGGGGGAGGGAGGMICLYGVALDAGSYTVAVGDGGDPRGAADDGWQTRALDGQDTVRERHREREGEKGRSIKLGRRTARTRCTSNSEPSTMSVTDESVTKAIDPSVRRLPITLLSASQGPQSVL